MVQWIVCIIKAENVLIKRSAELLKYEDLLVAQQTK